jgi:hypothetical protein
LSFDLAGNPLKGDSILSIRTKNDVRQGLRVTLQRLEQTMGVVEDAQAMAELKRIVLLRIAEIDAAEALNVAIENPKIS